MNKIADLNNYHDLSGLQELKAKANKDPESKEALQKAAQHFESIFIGMMLKSMREANAVFEKDNPMHSNTTNFFRDMYDQQLSTDMANNGSMGLADLIVQQLSGDDANYKSASVLRNDASLSRAISGDTPVHAQNKSASILGNFNSSIDKAFSEIGAQPPQVTTETKAKQAVNFDSPEDFVSQIWDYAKKAASKIGLNPAVMVAQSALETGWGKHIIKDKNGESSFNLFNVKAHRDWDGEKAAQSTLEFENGVAVRKVEPFRVYSGFTEAFDDFVGFLKSNNRYESALEKTNNSEQFLQSLQKAGYATDPNYADKIMGILNSDRFKQSIGNIASRNIGA